MKTQGSPVRSRWRWFVAPLVVAAAGCQRGPELGTVAGTVKLNGTPVPFAYVVFQPVDPPGPYGSAYANAQGEYELQFSRSSKGAPVGTHQISIRGPRGDEVPEEAKATPDKFAIPENYNEKTELKREVKPGHNEIDFELVGTAPAKKRQSRRGSSPRI